MNLIDVRIKQLQAQLGDPEVLDQKRVECKLEAFEECKQLLSKAEKPKPTAWTMERLHKTVTNPDKNSGFDMHLKHLWDNNNPKSIFTLTGLDVSHLMMGKQDTSGMQIKNP